MKRCSKCGVEKELTAEYFYRYKRSKDGYRGYCKECQKIMNSEYRVRNKEKVNKNQREYRAENKEKIARYQEQYYEEYRAKNKEKLARYHKQYNEENKEKRARYQEQYYEDNKEKIAKRNKQYYEDNKEKYARCRKQYYQSEQGRKNHAKARQNRRARKAQLPNTLTIEEYEDNLKHFNHSCAYCECELDEGNHHMEHVHPISRGIYGTTKENCIPSCDSCNLSKGAKTLAEWYVWTEHYSFERLLKIHEITSSGKEWVINQKEHTNK